MNSESSTILKNRPIIIGLITAFITAFVTTSFNDYLVFREQDAIHQLRIEQMQKNMELYGIDLRREMEQIRVIIANNDSLHINRIIALNNHKDKMIERVARLEAIVSKFQKQECSTWNPTKKILAGD